MSDTVGTPANSKPGQMGVQTERKAHEAWAGLIRENHALLCSCITS